MLRSSELVTRPRVLRALTGLTVAEFDALVAEAVPRLAAADHVRHDRPGRRRAIGAGHPFALRPRDQVLLTIVWLRVYLTNIGLGELFGVEESTVRRTTKRVLPVLEVLGRERLRPPDPGGTRVTLDAVLADAPELVVLIDTFEQRIQRPQDRTEADTYYSGKKKQHTAKTQVTVDERDGRFTDISETVRGPTADITLVKDSAVLTRLPPRVGAAGDLAYVGLAAVHPAGLGVTPRRKPRGQPRPAEDVAYNQAFARRRVTVEHSLRRLRLYEALTQTDRHHRRHLTARVVACAGLVNRQIAARAKRHMATVVTLPTRQPREHQHAA
jgi:hypothetical protein